MLNNYSDEQLRLAARLYHLDGLGQAEVARLVNVSQAKVSRLLSLARERGIVQISVSEYEPRNRSLEKQISRAFGLKTVAVIKTAENLSLENQRRAVAHFASPVVVSLLPGEGTIAISGGRTLREIVEHLPEDKARRLSVIQAMGSVDSNVGPVDASELGRSTAQRFGGTFRTLNTPAFVPNKAMRDSLLALEQIRSVWESLREVDVALIGIGTLKNSVFVERGVFTPADLKKLESSGAVGEICGRFFDKYGKECDSPWRDRVISIGLDQLRKTPQVIGLVAGNDRSAAIAAAIRGGLLKTLIIDESGAAALLSQISTPPKSKK